MTPIPALILGVVFVALSAVHIGWVLGGRWGLDHAVPTQNGEPLFRPGKALTFLVAVALLVAAFVAVWRGAYPNVRPAWIPRIGIWAIAVAFALRAVGDFRYCGPFKRVRDSEFARKDSLIYSPLCFLIAGLAAWLAVGY